MKLTLTPRDKKLLIGLAVFLLVVGGIFGILFPLKNIEKRLSEEVQTEQELMEENQKKIDGLESMEKERKEAGERLSALSEDYFPVMSSVEIEKMMTRLSIDKGVTMKDIEISMPEDGEYAQLKDYSKMLRQESEETQEEQDSDTFQGIYLGKAKMSMTGSRDGLQAMVDACQEKEPKMQVDEILWQKNVAEDGGEYTLAIQVSVYMAQDLEEYMNGGESK